jgi:hypothetical protein
VRLLPAAATWLDHQPQEVVDGVYDWLVERVAAGPPPNATVIVPDYEYRTLIERSDRRGAITVEFLVLAQERRLLIERFS